MSAEAGEKKVWSAEGMSQEDFMLQDQCILLDMQDNAIGCDNKYETHIFCPERPRAKLHRAFSVFLFDQEGKLMLQQRAASKITFPNVWTNTCCSHPLSGFGGTEVDSPEDVAAGNPMGVKRAAVRKLLHELGVPPEEVPLEKFKFLTRMHYWAADVVTHGPDSPFGEHEIDYILFIQLPKVTVKLNPEEVSAIKYVSLAELQEAMKPESGLLWSPWFRIIAQRFLPRWWEDLEKTINTDELADYGTIHRFDCSSEHRGGHGGAGEWLSGATVGPEGDGWMAAVAANGGKPPKTEPLKPLLKKVREDSNVYTLDDGNPRQTRIPCGHVCRVISFTTAEGASREQIDELLANSIFVAQREQGFVKVMRTQSQVSGHFEVVVIFDNTHALEQFKAAEEDTLIDPLRALTKDGKVTLDQREIELFA